MQLANYYIADVKPNRLFSSAVHIFSTIPPLFKWLSRKYWKTGIIVKLNKELSELYLITEGQKNKILELTKEDSLETYKKAEHNLNSYRKLYTLLEKVDFLNNPDTKEIAENTLSNFYFVESRIRMIAFSDSPAIPEDKSLIEFSSNLSLGSAQA